jgi:signal transduction histidine kinase
MWPKPRSLKWRLLCRLITLQAVALTALILLLMLGTAVLWRSGILSTEYEGGTLDAIRDSLVRDENGALVLRPTPELAALRAEIPNFWFIARDEQGHRLSEGEVPDQFKAVAAALDYVSEARLGWKAGVASPPAALIRWHDTAGAGKVQIMTGAQGHISIRRLVAAAPPLVLMALTNVVLPISILMALVTLAATPFVVRRAMSGLDDAAAQAERIDIDRRGVQLSVTNVPLEVMPLVKAVNDALDRLDKGYERHKRFLADAAHELRTPIAILTTRLSSLPSSPEKTQLLEDATRLSVLTGQLLDLQRLDQHPEQLAPVDLTGIARRVVLDLAPLAFAAGYEMAFEPEDESGITARGDQTSLERALTNLVQNAIDHGGRRGTITVRVARAGWIEVCDDGDGIPPAEREQVFEPFHRLKQGGRGAGLGLDLVQRIMQLHGGYAEVADGPSKGACLRMVFPKAQCAGSSA